jgi:hypothetical protein
MSAIAFPAARLRRRRRPPAWWRWIVALVALLRRLAAGSVDEIRVRFWLALPGSALWIAGIVISILERV